MFGSISKAGIEGYPIFSKHPKLAKLFACDGFERIIRSKAFDCATRAVLWTCQRFLQINLFSLLYNNQSLNFFR